MEAKNKENKENKEARKRKASGTKRGHDTLHGLNSNLTFLLGACLAHPDDTAANCVQLIAWNDLDDLSTLETETSAKPKTLGGAIDNQAGNPLRMGAEIDDHTGALLRDDALRATAIVSRKGGH